MRFTSRSTALWAGAVAVLASVASALGVFARGDGTYVSVTSTRGEVYEMATTGVYAFNARQLVGEGVGWDVFTLVVAVPALLVAAFLAGRGSFRGLLATGGMLGYFAYMYLEYAVTWAFGPLFPLFIAIFAASLVALVGVVTAVVDAGIRERFDDRFPRRSWAALSGMMGLLLTALWIGRIAEGLGAATPALYGETTMTVQALDLGLVVPASLLSAIAALRRQPAGLAAAAALSVTFVTMSAAIAAMMVSAWLVTGVVALAPIVVFTVASAAALVLAVRINRSVVGDAPPRTFGTLAGVVGS